MSDRLRLAVFIDFDNIEIGVKNTLNASFDAGLVLEALKERGEVVSKMAYSDWQRAGGYSRALTQHAIRMVQRNLTPGGDKNGADINLALDALEMAFTHPHINAFVIVGGDSDFISLVEKLKQYDKKVFVVGGRQFTSVIMQRNCHEFIAYELLLGGRRGGGGSREPRGERADISQAVPLVTRALAVLLERDVAPQLGLLKSTLLQLDSTFSERTYGAGSFRDFAEKLERAGVLRVYQGKGGLLVGPADGTTPDDTRATEATPRRRETRPVDETQQPEEGSRRRGAHPAETSGAPAEFDLRQMPAEPRVAEGVDALYRMISATGVKKWPLYLRHVKQIARAQTPPFDEREFGFASLMDLLRAAHKQGAFRVERDRQGVIRVFEGGSSQAPEAAADDTPSAAVVEVPLEQLGAPVTEPMPEVTMAVTAETTDEPAAEAPEPVSAAKTSSRRRRPARTAAKAASKSAKPKASPGRKTKKQS
jgi:uncharacterized LabA/DUF88 family protein